MSLAPTILLDFSTSNARGRATCTVPKSYGRPKRKTPRNTARSAQHEHSVDSFPLERRLSPRSDRLLWDPQGERRCRPLVRAFGIATRHPPDEPAVPFGPVSDRAALIIRPETNRADSEASSEAAARRERTALMLWHGRRWAHGACTQGVRLGGPHHVFGSSG